jgi:photosystem II stability/assembly factor-like uncharacterized protein
MKNIIILITALVLVNTVNSQWLQQTSGTDSYLYDMWMFSTESLIVCGEQGLILKTTNGGADWDSIPCPSASTQYIFFLNANTGWISGGDSLIKTVNGGNTWTFLSNTSGRAPFFTDANTGWMGAGNSSIKRSTNGGVNWTFINMPVNSITHDVYFVNANTGFVKGTRPVSDSTYIYKTTNGGTNWNVLRGFNEIYAGMQIVDENTIYLCGFHGAFTKTTNGGAAWEGNSANTTEALEKVVFTDTQNGFVCGGYGVIFATTNGGSSWQDQTLQTGESFSKICFMPQNNQTGYVAGSDGAIYKTTNGGVIGIQQISSEVPSKYSLAQNYPNPFNPVTNIKFSIPKAGNVKLAVFDITGREVAELVNSQLSAGTYKADFNAENLSSGVYFYKLVTNEFTEVKKMILVK